MNHTSEVERLIADVSIGTLELVYAAEESEVQRWFPAMEARTRLHQYATGRTDVYVADSNASFFRDLIMVRIYTPNELRSQCDWILQ